ncbi:hypothetical protein N6H18_15255 [Reichenbachiella agarivorans]|uniref:Uncharacterized protein n=1 Tax=Reichenbachiella agarivorans TaxID=2979464 RepID=A0ABY6CMH4_9BACT|nr:hypothetical protein [Reichenbachiella agarivorans]UXP31706.1 hypothetical protein N6H18_15255 [Reichenbachiella agarivorans]
MRKKSIQIGIVILGTVLTMACENQDVNYGSGPNFSEIHEDIHWHFDRTVIEGVEYHILERDRNNPHEGFGFMALNGVDFRDNQDSIKAMLRTIMELQIENAAALQKVEKTEVEEYANSLFQYYLKESRTPHHVVTKKEADQ